MFRFLKILTMTDKRERYQDYVIRDGQFVGHFEEMYSKCGDPWHQSTEDLSSTSRIIGIEICRRLNARLQCRRVVEIGCGIGRYTNLLSQTGVDVVGLDVSTSAVAKARAAFPKIKFEVAGITDHQVIERLAPDVIVMSHVTWYVLPWLRDFLAFLKTRLPSTMLFHIVSTYDPTEQKYGKEFFTTPDEIRAFFGMTCYEWGEIHGPHGTDAYFLGAWSPNRLSEWKAIPE